MRQYFKMMAFVSTFGFFQSLYADPLKNPEAPVPTPYATAQPTSAMTATPLSTPVASKELSLGGRLGVGSGLIDARTGSTTCLSIRDWLSNGVCLDLLGYYNGYSNNGTDFLGNPTQAPVYFEGLGLGAKFNLVEVHKNLFFQLATQMTYYENYSESDIVDERVQNDFETWGLFVGLNFEYFIPFFDALSIETSFGFMQGFDTNVTTITYNHSYLPTYTNSKIIGKGTDNRLQINGGNLEDILLHFYF